VEIIVVVQTGQQQIPSVYSKDYLTGCSEGWFVGGLGEGGIFHRAGAACGHHSVEK